ncbi:MAG: phosphoenolpyruvate kinase [Elusimicrobia bacterium]|nr:phosphoenolpyruvate kinase [Elusimicrobiota bacterium]
MKHLRTVLEPESIAPILAALADAEDGFLLRHPGHGGERRPVHVLYGGAHLFSSDTPSKLGTLARKALDSRLPDAAALERVLGIDPRLAGRVRERVVEKLVREPVEDFRIDFEDGYGPRPDAEEDAHALGAAVETAEGMRRGTLPPFIGIRIKPLTTELSARAARTLDVYLSTLLAEVRGTLPKGFVVTLPKVAFPEQVLALADLLERIERAHVMRAGTIKVELMLETPQALLSPDGSAAPRLLAEAARGRCTAVHLGPFDLTSALEVDAGSQALDHPLCSWALRLAAAALGGTGIALSDGPVPVIPLGDDPAAAEAALALHYRQVRRALADGVHRGWDLHPAQLPTRYAALYAHYLENLDAASARLKRFLEGAAKAVASQTAFDDAATAQGLLNFFSRGLACGALTPEDAARAGLAPRDLALRSFAAIVEARR